MDIYKNFAERFDQNEKTILATQSDIQKLETEFKVYLPEEFKTFATIYGDLYTPDILDIIDDEDIDLADVQEFWTIEKIIEDKKHMWTSKLSIDLIPFASDCMGNIFAFKTKDIKTPSKDSAIYFFDHDFDEVNKVASSFKKWIETYNKI